MLDAQTLTFTLRGPDNSILTPALRKACDRCRRRKTKCDGLDECTSCAKAGTVCSYLTVHKRKGPKARGQRPRLSSLGHCSDSHIQTNYQSTIAPNQDLFTTENIEEFQRLEQIDSRSSETRSHETESIFSHDTLLSSTQSEHSPGDVWRDEPCEISIPWEDQIPPAFEAMAIETNNDTLSSTQYQTHPNVTTVEPVFEARVGNHMQSNHTLPMSVFKPYLTLFFERLYPIFPVLEREHLLEDNLTFQSAENPISVGQYALLTSLCAAVITQLNILNQTSLIEALSTAKLSDGSTSISLSEVTFFSADFFVAQCLNARQQWEYMDMPDEHTIMTSFFLFEYYGQRNQSHRAWYYLRESVGFALSMGLDNMDSYTNLPTETSQRRCRIFWLLFVTERAYALQHRSGVMLHASVDLPKIFESKDPKLIYGFVNLVTLFKSVDDSFVSAWKGRRSSDTDRNTNNHLLATKQQQFLHLEQQNARGSAEGALVLEIDEIQRLDFMVTQQWLYLLSWQLKNRPAMSPDQQLIKGGMRRSGIGGTGSILYPFRISKDLLGIINGANRQSLECHGIGMEQKIFDVACCLSDVLGTSHTLGRETFSAGHQILHGFMTMLASFRNQESRYLQPLLSKAATVLSSVIPPPMIEDNRNRCEEWNDEQQWGLSHIM